MKYLAVLSGFAGCALLPTTPVADPLVGTKDEMVLAAEPAFKTYKVDPYIAAATRLHAGGKSKAAAALLDLCKRGGGWNAILLSRVLFVSKPMEEFRPPALGGPHFVGPTDSRVWPLEPIEVVDGVPFLVVRGYSLGGYPEPPTEYLDYCFKNCDWNLTALTPKTGDQKKKALAKLVTSEKWEKLLSEEAKLALAAQIE